jgi:23S rRNA (guanosine2251-2'-O)-methyltransferase
VRDEGVEVPPTEAEEAMPGPGFDAAWGGPSERTVEPNLSTPRPTPRSTPRPDYRRRAGGYPDRPQNRPSGPAPARWQRSTAGSPSSELLGEDEELVAGRHPVEEAFIAHRKALRLLVVPQRRQALEKLVLHATNLRIPIVEIEGGTLTSLAGFDGHQGIALVTDRRQFASLDDILARAIERHEAPFVLVLDSLEDPQNFGSLLRTAEASGVHGVVYPTHRQAPLSAAAIKASAGAVEHLLLLPVEDLAEALTDLHIRGLRIVGTDAEAPLTVRQADLRGPAAIVVGSEGQGLGPAVRRRCDTVVRIPMRGRVTSLNASVAGSILLYEASSQRGGERALIAPATDQEPAPGLEPEAEPGTDPGLVAATGPDVELEASASPAELQPRPRRRASARTNSETPAVPPARKPEPGADEELLPGGPAVGPTPSDEPG